MVILWRCVTCHFGEIFRHLKTPLEQVDVSTKTQREDELSFRRYLLYSFGCNDGSGCNDGFGETTLFTRDCSLSITEKYPAAIGIDRLSAAQRRGRRLIKPSSTVHFLDSQLHHARVATSWSGAALHARTHCIDEGIARKILARSGRGMGLLLTRLNYWQ